MSIALLGQVYDDMRRLAVAGSAVAPNDFRLKKHIAPLEAAGAKAPVFAKVAEQVKAVVESNEKTASLALLELASLVNAVLYTQGDTAVPGTLAEIETTELDLAGAAQVSARTLKPLSEALSKTGSGRMELIKDAHERGAFKDPRLVKPSLFALDDGYTEIADFVAAKVLPLYGRAILPELRAKFNVKGKGGDARRLALLHQLDPAATRPLVEQTLEGGSKEVKVAAIECLGDGPGDLGFLLDQAEARAHDVRAAAYLALAKLEDPAAVAVLQKAMTKDVSAVLPALTISKLPVVWRQLIDTIQSLVDELKTVDKKTVSAYVERAQRLLSGLWNRNDNRIDDFLSKLFSERAALVKLKGETLSGGDLQSAVIAAMVRAGAAVQATLAAAHAELKGDDLGNAFVAARKQWPADRLLKEFRGYLAADAKARKAGRRNTILDAICGAGMYFSWAYGLRLAADVSDDKLPKLHPDWLDAAIDLGDLEAVTVLGRPGHVRQNRFLRQTFDTLLQKTKSGQEPQQVVSAMVKLQHPDATDCLIAAVAKADKKAHWFSYHYVWLIPDLPADAIPKLEAIIPTLPDRDADYWLGRIEQLRAKHRISNGEESRDR